MEKSSEEAVGLGGVTVEDGADLEKAVLSSALLSGGVIGGVGSPVEVEGVKGSLTEQLSDGFLS